jgi:hypothetical protein
MMVIVPCVSGELRITVWLPREWKVLRLFKSLTPPFIESAFTIDCRKGKLPSFPRYYCPHEIFLAARERSLFSSSSSPFSDHLTLDFAGLLRSNIRRYNERRFVTSKPP